MNAHQDAITVQVATIREIADYILGHPEGGTLVDILATFNLSDPHVLHALQLDRGQLAVFLRSMRYSYREIGQILGCTRQRAWQIVQAAHRRAAARESRGEHA